MNCVDDAYATAGSNSVNSLRVLQVRIHACRGFKKPGPQMKTSMFRIAFVVGDQISSSERGHLQTQTHQGATMLDEILGIRHSVALNVWAIWILRIRPPVITLREKVM